MKIQRYGEDHNGVDIMDDGEYVAFSDHEKIVKELAEMLKSVRCTLNPLKKAEDSCESCGVPWHDHLGISGTCAKLEKARKQLQCLREWALFRDGDLCGKYPVDFKLIAARCDTTLEEIK